MLMLTLSSLPSSFKPELQNKLTNFGSQAKFSLKVSGVFWEIGTSSLVNSALADLGEMIKFYKPINK